MAGVWALATTLALWCALWAKGSPPGFLAAACFWLLLTGGIQHYYERNSAKRARECWRKDCPDSLRGIFTRREELTAGESDFLAEWKADWPADSEATEAEPHDRAS
jgi:hypothetical protein